MGQRIQGRLQQITNTWGFLEVRGPQDRHKSTSGHVLGTENHHIRVCIYVYP